MNITRELRNECGASGTCDKVYDTDDPQDVIVQGRTTVPAEMHAEQGVPDGEGLMRMKRAVLAGIDPAPMLTAQQMMELLCRAERDILRVETLPRYADDGPEYRQYLRGEPGPDVEWKQGWLDTIAEVTRTRTWRVARVIHGPATDYLAYEIAWCYPLNADAGQTIRVVDDNHPCAPLLAHAGDYLVIDGATVIRMHYGADAAFTGAQIVTQDPAIYVALGEMTWTAATPFANWRPGNAFRARRSAA